MAGPWYVCFLHCTPHAKLGRTLDPGMQPKIQDDTKTETFLIFSVLTVTVESKQTKHRGVHPRAIESYQARLSNYPVTLHPLKSLDGAYGKLFLSLKVDFLLKLIKLFNYPVTLHPLISLNGAYRKLFLTLRVQFLLKLIVNILRMGGTSGKGRNKLLLAFFLSSLGVKLLTRKLQDNYWQLGPKRLSWTGTCLLEAQIR